jgi:hypothetical protein
MRADRPGQDLRAGESVLCVAYDPTRLGVVVLVRCKTEGQSPGALVPVEELESLGPEPLTPSAWSKRLEELSRRRSSITGGSRRRTARSAIVQALPGALR